MIPGLGNMNPAQMKKMMQQLGIKNTELPAIKVIFELADKKLIVTNPSVTEIEMQGQKSFQVSGEITEEAAAPNEEDIQLIMEQASVSKEQALQALQEHNNDLAQAIASLKKEE